MATTKILRFYEIDSAVSNAATHPFRCNSSEPNRADSDRRERLEPPSSAAWVVRSQRVLPAVAAAVGSDFPALAYCARECANRCDADRASRERSNG